MQCNVREIKGVFVGQGTMVMLFSAFTTFFILGTSLQPWGLRVSRAIQDFGIVFGCLIAALVTFQTARCSSGNLRRAWECSCISSGALAVAFLSKAWYDVVRNVDNPNSLGLVLGGGISLVAAIVGLALIPTPKLSLYPKIRGVIDGDLIFFSVVAVILTFVQHGGSVAMQPSFLSVVSYFIPAFGGIVAVTLAVVVMLPWQEKDRTPWAFLVAGFATFTSSEIVIATFELTGRTNAPPFAYFGYPLTFFCICMAARVRAPQFRRIPDDQLATAPPLIAPYFFALLAVIVIVGWCIWTSTITAEEIGAGIVLLVLIDIRQVLIIIENHGLSIKLGLREKQLSHHAFHDGLTSLSNRLALDSRLAEITHSPQASHVAVMMIDLDRFKRVNDTFGHPAGDELLKVVGKRLIRCVRDSDTVVRIGGDEFAVLLEDSLQRDAAANVARNIIASLTAPVAVAGNTFDVGASVGIALAEGEPVDPIELVRKADSALYSAKNAGGNTYQFYEPSMSRAFYERLDLETQMRQAIDSDEFYVAYQPIFDLKLGLPIGVEALLRWQHPTKGILRAEAFQLTAEETGMIVPLGEKVITQAGEALKRWRNNLSGGESLFVAINISARQVRTGNLVAQMESAFQGMGEGQNALCLEVNETVLMENQSSFEAMTKRLGVKLTLDNFGTGRSSLSRLSSLPVDAIKIDRTFLRQFEPEQENYLTPITQAVTKLGQALGLGVGVIGITSSEQLAHLQSLGCNFGQGSLLGQPMSANHFEGWWPKAIANVNSE